ncbi:hypothetical protein HN446_03505 [bacterium]|nr:hypothetical protein [bacterium]
MKKSIFLSILVTVLFIVQDVFPLRVKFRHPETKKIFDLYVNKDRTPYGLKHTIDCIHDDDSLPEDRQVFVLNGKIIGDKEKIMDHHPTKESVIDIMLLPRSRDGEEGEEGEECEAPVVGKSEFNANRALTKARDLLDRVLESGATAA